MSLKHFNFCNYLYLVVFFAAFYAVFSGSINDKMTIQTANYPFQFLKKHLLNYTGENYFFLHKLSNRQHELLFYIPFFFVFLIKKYMKLVFWFFLFSCEKLLLIGKYFLPMIIASNHSCKLIRLF